LLLSDAEREWILSALSRHAAAGRLEVDELERRVETVMTASTREQATATLADLPPLPDAHAGSGGRSRRGSGHGDAAAAQPDWTPTSERFRDPRSGRVMRVWLDPAGGRHYVAEDQPAGC
jgi:hypothetical protein